MYFHSSQKHYQTPVHNAAFGHSFPLHIAKSCSSQIHVCLISIKVFQIMNSAVSGEMLQVVFSFQNSVKVTYVRHFLISSVYYKCSYKLIISFSQIALVYTSIELTSGTLIIKIKNSICACSIVLRVFIYASNDPLCGTLIINFGKISICACYCKQKKILCKNQIRIQNMY